MDTEKKQGLILVIDDEWESAIVKHMCRKLEEEGWRTLCVDLGDTPKTGDNYENYALYAIEDNNPDGILLDVRFGEHRDDQFRGLEILQKIVKQYPRLPVLMFTQYAQGPEREIAVRGTLQWNSPVDFIDKLAGADEVILRLRRLIGDTPEIMKLGELISLDINNKVVFIHKPGVSPTLIDDINGIKFEILKELAITWYKSPSELVPFNKLERYFEGEEARASLRVRIREIKDSLGKTMGIRFGASDLIMNIRDQGYRLSPPDHY
jgi:DNA-binding response OmpR family regulator